MKKILCILLSVMMILSPTFVTGASAADGYVVTNPVTDSFSTMEEFHAENAGKTFYGFTYDFLYNSTSFVDWTKLDITYEKEGTTVKATGNSLALARADMNMYIKRLFTAFFGGEKLYTEEYATKITNFVGKMLDSGFVDKTISFGTNPNPNEEDFFEIIANESGLTDLVQKKWIDPIIDIDFKSFLSAYGVNLTGLLPGDYDKGEVIATELLRAAAEKILFGGPVDFVFNLVWHYSKNYNAGLYESTMALFDKKIKTSEKTYTTDELKTIEALFEIMFGNITDFRLMPFPKTRLSQTSEIAEAQLFMMMYISMNYMYKDNAAEIGKFIGNFNNFFSNSRKYTAAGYDNETISLVLSNITMMFECMLTGNISQETLTMLENLTQENIDATPDDLLTRIKNSIAKIFRKIADYFDYVFKVLTGEIEYGKPY